MNKMAPRGPLGLKQPRQGKDPARLAAVADMPCCVCHEYGLPQASITQVHHCIHGRHGTRRAPDSMTIPLCEGHHQGLLDTSQIALHREPELWRKTFGLDVGWIGWVEERLHVSTIRRNSE